MGKVNLDSINTEKFYFNPKKPDFVRESFKYKEFDLKDFPELRENLLTYIIVLYDKESPIRKDKDAQFVQKKRHAAEISGLMDRGKIIEKVVDVLLGANDQFNKAMAKYLTFQHSLELTRVAILELAQEKAIINTMRDGDAKSIDLAMRTTKDLESALNEVSGGSEWYKMREAIQEEASKMIDGIRVEDHVEIHEKGELESPYPNYKQKDVKFISHRKPE